MKWSYKIGLGALIVVLLLIAALRISPFGQFARSFDYEEDRDPFDKNAWTIHWTKHTYDENNRHFMLQDLRDNYLKEGMDSIEVKRLLGEPERDFGFSYHLGFYKSGLDPTFLILEFDDKGKLKEIKVETI